MEQPTTEVPKRYVRRAAAPPAPSRLAVTPSARTKGRRRAVDIRINEVADRIYRFSTFVPGVGPTGFTFNQYLIDDDQPLLFHTGLRHMFPDLAEAIGTLTPLDNLRWITF